MTKKSRKRTLLLLLGAAVVIAVGLWYRFGDEVSAVKREIRQANYCETNADCKVITGQCPFGCYIPVNVSQGDRIEVMVDAYQSACTYSCAEYKGVDCVDRRCQVRQ